MSGDRDIREAIEYLAGVNREDKVYSFDAIVNNVDESKRTCECQIVSGKVQNVLDNVRLMASVDDGVLIVPALGSNVTIIISNFTDPYITSYSEVEKIVLRGGDLGGLVKIVELTSKLNNLENAVNDLISKFNSHTHNVTAVGSPTGPNLAPEETTLQPTIQDEIENKSITQG